MLADLDLVLCSETIDAVSISTSQAVQATNGSHVSSGNLRKEYRSRKGLHDCSMHQYYHRYKMGVTTRGKKKIPHYVGVNGQPCYPVRESYAKSVLLIHKPWRHESDHQNRNWISEFNEFLYSSHCPDGVKIAYNRVKLRCLQKMTGYDPVSKDVNTSSNPVSEEDTALIEMSGMHSIEIDRLEKDDLLQSVNRGIQFDWSQDLLVSSIISYSGVSIATY